MKWWRRRSSESESSRLVWLLAAAAAAAAAALASPPSRRLAATEERPTSCEWPAAASHRPGTDDQPAAGRGDGARHRLEKRRSPFAAGWKRLEDEGGPARPRRPFAGDEQRARYAFSSWGGKRSPMRTAPPPPRLDSTAFDAQRQPAFAGWAQGKRSRRFFNWGGKRSLMDDELERMLSPEGGPSQMTTTTTTTTMTIGYDDTVAPRSAAIAGNSANLRPPPPRATKSTRWSHQPRRWKTNWASKSKSKSKSKSVGVTSAFRGWHAYDDH